MQQPVRRILVPSLKDESGAYEKRAPDLSIDSLLKRSLETVDLILLAISQQAKTGSFDRNSVMSLKDCVTMLLEFKKKESEILEELSDEQLDAMVKK